MFPFLKRKSKSSNPESRNSKSYLKDFLLPRRFRSRANDITSGSNDGQTIVAPADASMATPQNHPAVVGPKVMSPRSIPNVEDQMRLCRSNKNVRSTSRPSPPQHALPTDAVRGKRHVRFPGPEHTPGAEGILRLNASLVRCTFIVAYQQDFGAKSRASRYEVSRHEQLAVEFEEEAAFSELHAIATEALVKSYKRTPEAYYLKVGRYRLVRDDTQAVAARGILEQTYDWSDGLPRTVHAFRGQCYKVDFHVDIEWEYSSLHTEQIPEQPYAKIIRNAIESKVQKNWEGKFFIPRKDLQQLMTIETISSLVHEDESLRSSEALRLNGGSIITLDQLTKKIYLWAARLLAWCVYSRLQLVCLYHMLQNGLQDTDLPLTIENCPDKTYLSTFQPAVDHSGGFAAYTFVRNEGGLVDHHDLHDDAITPLIFEESDLASVLGQGNFGRVFKVRINRDHHAFSDHEDEYFAFKKVYDSDATKIEDEAEVLAKLRKAPHPNITTHLASWKQKNICYILFRCADYDLGNYMISQPAPAWTSPNLIAIISQMAGLVDGLRHIHNMGLTVLQPANVQEQARSSLHHLSQAAYHRDLKPANILVSIDKDDGSLRLSITDFGSARIGQSPSHVTDSLHPGDLVYAAPDRLVMGDLSRPYDLWSMGCIFLEILTWMVGIEGIDLNTFKYGRLQTIAHPDGHQDTAFWYQDKSGVLLKPAVVAQLKLLKEQCKGRGVFPDIISLTGRLLNVHAHRRPDAAQLSNAFKAIMLQLEQDLKNEDFYLGPLSTRIIIAAPPTPTALDGGLSRTPSIDERPAIVHSARPP